MRITQIAAGLLAIITPEAAGRGLRRTAPVDSLCVQLWTASAERLCAIGNGAAVRVLPAATRFGRAASVDTLARRGSRCNWRL